MISRLRYGNTNTFLIRGESGYLLVDTDYAGTMSAFYGAIKKYDIKVSDISYVLATHYHPDHIGLVSELMKQGVKLLLIDTQPPHIHYADEIFSRDKRLNYEPINADDAIVVGVKESRKFLKNMGIEGGIVSTPSHSEDSVSLILDNGVCIVGDLEPIEYLDAYDENVKLKEDWELVMSYSPKIIYYAHANEKSFEVGGVNSMILETNRLILRPWTETDAESLYEYAKDPAIGPIAGWPPHKSVAESLDIIKNVFNGAQCYAICEKGTDKAIGTIELKLNGHTDMTEKDDECELGYWIGKPFWGRGYMPEAAKELLRYGFEELGMTTIWCGYYDGNDKSKRVQEKVGFVYHHRCDEVPVPLMNEIRVGHTSFMTKEHWDELNSKNR